MKESFSTFKELCQKLLCVCVCAINNENMNLKPQFHITSELKSYTYINLHFPVQAIVE
jgi:hypothetical protein